MLKITLSNNIFSFYEELYSQKEGTGMVPKHPPHYPNICMAQQIYLNIKDIFEIYEKGINQFFNRLYDDLFKMFTGTKKEIPEIFQQMNLIHTSIKFTMSHTTNISEPLSDKC